MTQREIDLWRKCGAAAAQIMGTEKIGHGAGTFAVSRADQDPLAWWCATELIHNIASKGE